MIRGGAEAFAQGGFERVCFILMTCVCVFALLPSPRGQYESCSASLMRLVQPLEEAGRISDGAL